MQLVLQAGPCADAGAEWLSRAGDPGEVNIFSSIKQSFSFTFKWSCVGGSTMWEKLFIEESEYFVRK